VGRTRKDFELLRDTYPYLDFSDGDALRYIADQHEHAKSLPKRKRPTRDEFVTCFLLSTDFFQNGGQTPAAVKYVALWNPSQVPCQSPFARFD
jgi:hypothetical protein